MSVIQGSEMFASATVSPIHGLLEAVSGVLQPASRALRMETFVDACYLRVCKLATSWQRKKCRHLLNLFTR